MKNQQQTIEQNMNAAKEQLIRKVHDAGIENDPLFKKCLPVILADSFLDPGLAEILNYKIQMAMLEENKPYPFKPYPSQEDLNGSAKLAHVKFSERDESLVTPIDFGIFPYDLLGGMLIGGKPKAGKSTFIFSAIFSLMQFIKRYNMDTSIWIFDNKRDFECLIKYFPEALLIDSSNLRINFLEYNEAVGKQKWLNNFTETFSNIMNVWEGSSNLLSASIEELSKIYEAVNSTPSIHDLLKYLPSRKFNATNRTNDYRGSIINRIDGLINSTNEILRVSKGFDFENDLANKKLVIFSLHDLKPEAQAIMTIIPILRIFAYRMAKSQRFNYPRNIFVFDEAKRIFPKRSEASHTGASVTTKLFLESREFGCSFILADHQISELNSAVQQAAIKVNFRLGENCIPETAKNMGLTKEQAQYFFHLQQGEAICRYDRFPYPFVIQTENMMRYIDKNISREEIEKRMTPIWSELKKNVQPARPEILEQHLKNKTSSTNDKNSEEAQSSLLFDVDTIKLLENIYSEPFNSVTTHYKNTALSASKGNRIVKELIEKNLVQKVKVRKTKGRGNLLTLLELTKQGLRKLGKGNRLYGFKGSLVHAYYCKKVEDYYKAHGFETKREYLNADITAKTPEGIVALELCIHTENIASNVERNKANGFSKSVLIFESKDKMQKAKVEFQQQPNVEFKIIDEFLE